jgi:hypothetical protein
MILDNIKDYLYRKERYQLNFALAIGICDSDICMRGFSNHIRQTDNFIVLEESYLCCVVLDGISVETAIKATSNLQTIFQNRYFGENIFISMVTSIDYGHDCSYKMINSLLDLLEYSIFNNMSHEVIDHSHIECSL